MRLFRALLALLDIDLGTIHIQEPYHGLRQGDLAFVLPGSFSAGLPQREVLILEVRQGGCLARGVDGRKFGWGWYEVVPLSYLDETDAWARKWIKRPEDLDILYTVSDGDRHDVVSLRVILTTWRRRYPDSDVIRLYCRLVVAHPATGMPLYPPDHTASPIYDGARIHVGVLRPRSNVVAYTKAV